MEKNNFIARELFKSQLCCTSWIALSRKPESFIKNTYLSSQYLIVPIRCKSKFCPYCNSILSHDLSLKLSKVMLKDEWRFFTLTISTTDKTLDEQLKILDLSFRKLYFILRKKFPKIKYFKIIECGEGGNLHIHGIWNIYIPQPELSTLWLNVSGSPIVWLKYVYGTKKMSCYLRKYISKTFKTFAESGIKNLYKKKIFSTSQNFFIKEEKIPSLYEIISKPQSLYDLAAYFKEYLYFTRATPSDITFPDSVSDGVPKIFLQKIFGSS